VLAANGHGCRIGKPHRLGLSVARKLAREEHIDRDAVLGVAQTFASGNFST
jgi:hypothetical protein